MKTSPVMSSLRHQRRGKIEVDNDGVAMTVRREMRLRHASDTVVDTGIVFGGDTMGHWNVDRINRLLDAFNAPVREIQLAESVMRNMAAVGAPDLARVSRYVALPRSTMPPLSFVAFMVRDEHGLKVRSMMIDGHHRLLALAMNGASSIPIRILPPELADDVRVVEMLEAAVFPEPRMPEREVELGRYEA